MKIMRAAVLFIVLALAISCSTDKGAELVVIQVLDKAKIVSDPDFIEAAFGQGAESEKGRQFYKAKEEISILFVSNAVEKRVLATLRLYNPKGWEALKTVTEQQGTFVVMNLRSDSELMGEPVQNRPGWRKALFRVEKKDGAWRVADLDSVVKNYGEKPFSLDQGGKGGE